jgi:phage shock protein PspC (stress-responsive transcriptional regulator)
MFRRPKFIRSLPAREWLAMLAGGVCLGLLAAWLERKFQLDPRVVRLVLSFAAVVLFVWCVLILVAYVKELRREEEEWAGRGGGDGGGAVGDADPE